MARQCQALPQARQRVRLDKASPMAMEMSSSL